MVHVTQVFYQTWNVAARSRVDILEMKELPAILLSLKLCFTSYSSGDQKNLRGNMMETCKFRDITCVFLPRIQ